MSTLSERIKKARLEAGLSQEGLAKAISQLIDNKKISRTAITQWESNKTKEIEASNLLKAAKVLNTAPEWLQFGHGTMKPRQVIGFGSNAGFVPLLSEVQAVNSMEKEKEIISNVGLDERLAKIASPHSFALCIKDNSMAPVFTAGDVIIIDPDIPPSPGEFVAATLEQNSEIIFRKYRPLLNNSSAKHFELIALNEDWGKIIADDKCPAKIIGTLIEHRCRRRIPNYSDKIKIGDKK